MAMNQDPSPLDTTTPAAPDVEALLDKARALFAVKEQERGTPEAPTQAGFLALARAGKEVWNAWRKAYPKPAADFSGADFRGDAAIDFSGFSFGEVSIFINAKFGNDAIFRGAKFGNCAIFEGAQFGNGAGFGGAQFGYGARFSGAHFGDGAWFQGAQFGNEIMFEGAQFGNGTMFEGAQFGACTSFDGVRFNGQATFAAWDTLSVQNFWEAVHKGSAQQRVDYAKAEGLRSNSFNEVSFRGVQFEGDASFQGRIFLSKTDFGPISDEMTVKTSDGEKVIPKGQPTCFQGIPNFHGCTLHQNTDIIDADFSSESSAEAARAYRTLKLAFAQQHALREEQKFFRLEMRAETGIATGHRKWLYRRYEKISDYGFSLKRPIKFWLVCLAGFALFYGLLTGTYGWNGNISWERTLQWMHYALLNAVPLPGFDKTLDALRSDLFHKAEAIQFIVTVLEILHKTVSLLAFFLIGLALRNLFKMKG